VSDLFCFLDPKGYDLMILRMDGGGRMALWMSMGDGSGIIRAVKVGNIFRNLVEIE